VFPSYYEGNSVALLEMLAGGLYTLASSVGAAAEVIRPGVNGEILERTDLAWATALSRHLTTPPARVRDGLPQSYRWEEVAARVESVYAAARIPLQ
jgi:glycosyltransferase involved in cell wall biosynthesis